MSNVLIGLANTVSRLVGQALRPAARLLDHLPLRLQARWFGSDVLVGSTTNYTWTANQFGHFTIGLFIYGAVHQVLTWITAYSLAGSAVGEIILGLVGLVLTVGFYAVKETQDFRLAQVPGRQFANENVELRLDGFADSFFVGFGAAFLMTWLWTWPGWWVAWVAVIVVFGGVAVLLGRFYLPRADRFDFSNLPNYYRLQLFPGQVEVLDENIPDKAAHAARAVTAMACNESDLKALLVLGGPGTGRTSLLLGIGTRLAIAKAKLRFIQAGKLNADFAEELARQRDTTEPLAYNFDLWALQDVTHVLIDDAPADVAKGYLEALAPEVRAVLRDRTLVIVINGGAESMSQAHVTAQRWREALTAALQLEPKIAAVISTRHLDPRRRNTALMQE